MTLDQDLSTRAYLKCRMFFLMTPYGYTWVRVDWNFPLSVQLELTRSMRSLVRYQVTQEKRNSITTGSHVLFYLLSKHTNDDFFDDFPKISKDNPRFPRKRRYYVLCNHSNSNSDFLVTMATPISLHVKDKNSIFTARDEDMRIF